MRPRKKPFHGLGIIIEGAIAAAQMVTLGTATAVQQDKVRKAQRNASSTLKLLHLQRMSEIKTEGEKLEESLRLKAETSLYDEKRIRTAAFMGVTTVVLASFVLLYFLLKGAKSDE